MVDGDTMKCVFCDKPAEYIMAGHSVCGIHADNVSSWDMPGEWSKMSVLAKRLKEQDERRG